MRWSNLRPIFITRYKGSKQYENNLYPHEGMGTAVHTAHNSRF